MIYKTKILLDPRESLLVEEALNMINMEKIENTIAVYSKVFDYEPNPINVMNFVRTLSILIPDIDADVILTEYNIDEYNDFMQWLGVQGPVDTKYLMESTDDSYIYDVDDALLRLYMSLENELRKLEGDED